MQKKGQTLELMELLILVVGTVVLISVFYFLSIIAIPSSSDILAQYHQYERVTDAVNAFYYSKISGTEKTLAQMVGDRVVSENPVSYGKAVGTIDVDKLVMNFFNSYFEKNWRLEIRVTYKVNILSPDTSKGTKDISWGQKIPSSIKKTDTYYIIILTPTDDLAGGYLYVW